MKKILLAIGGLMLILGTNVNAASYYTSTLNLSYGSYMYGQKRYYAKGDNAIDIEVDGFNTQSGTVRKSGKTTNEVLLNDVGLGRILHSITKEFTYGTCVMLNMGSYDTGYRDYGFYSYIYYPSSDTYVNYDGLKSDRVLMYPKA